MSVPDQAHPPVVAGHAALRLLHRHHAQLHRRPAAAAGGQLLCLLCSGVTVVPVRRVDQAWECVTVAIGGAEAPAADQPRPPLVLVPDVEVETALPVRVVDPVGDVDPAMYGLVWLARVWQHFPGGPVPQLAAALVEVHELDGVIRLTNQISTALVSRAHLTLPAIRVGLERLTRAGLLTRTDDTGTSDGGEEGCPAYTLRAAGPAAAAQLKVVRP